MERALKKFRNSFLYRKWARFLTLFGDIMVRTKPPLVKGEHIREMLFATKPGMVMCRKYNCYLDSFFIKGEFSHSGLITTPKYVRHAIAEGVCKIDVIDFIDGTDGFIILDPPYKTDEDRTKAVEYAVAQEGKPYDFLFKVEIEEHSWFDKLLMKLGFERKKRVVEKSDVEYFYCHELTYRALQAGGVDVPFDGQVVYADDLIKVCKTVYEFNPID